MRLKPRLAWFLAFTAAFAVLAGFVFWGTWSPDVTPVMPDCPTVHPIGYFAALSKIFGEACLANWQFIPDDILVFLGTPYFRQEIQFVLAAYFAALGVVYYCRGRGLAHAASYSAGLLLGFCGYWFTLFSAGHLGWFHLMTYCVFAFGLSDRAIRKGKLKNWLLLAAVLAWGARHQQDMWMIFTIFTGFYFIWCCIRERKIPDWKGLGVALLVFAIIGGANIRTAFSDALAGREKQLAESKGSVLSGGEGRSDEEAKWIFVTNWSMPPEDTFEFFNSRVHGDTSCPFTLGIGNRIKSGVTLYTGRLGRPLGAADGNYRQHSLYVGWVTCLLALCAICLAVRFKASPQDARQERRSSDLCFFAAMAIVFWVLSMGRFCEPVYRIIFHIPFLNSLRAPVKWHHATELCLCILAAYGVDALWRSKLATLRVWFRPLILAIVLFGAFDLARIDRLYCAPVDLKEAKRTGSNYDLSLLRGADFQNPHVAAMLNKRRIIPIGRCEQLGGDLYVVGIVSPRRAYAPPPQPPLWVKLLGLMSFAGTVAVSIYGVKKS